MDMSVVTIMAQFGGLGVLALFAWYMLKASQDSQSKRDQTHQMLVTSTIEQQKALAEMLNNHLRQLLEEQVKIGMILDKHLAALDRHDQQELVRHQEVLTAVRSLEKER